MLSYRPFFYGPRVATTVQIKINYNFMAQLLIKLTQLNSFISYTQV